MQWFKKHKVFIVINQESTSFCRQWNLFLIIFQFSVSSPDVNTKRISQAVQNSGDLKQCRRNHEKETKIPHPPTCVSAAKLPRRKSTEKKRPTERERDGKRRKLVYGIVHWIRNGISPRLFVKELLQNYIVPWCSFLQWIRLHNPKWNHPGKNQDLQILSSPQKTTDYQDWVIGNFHKDKDCFTHYRCQISGLSRPLDHTPLQNEF